MFASLAGSYQNEAPFHFLAFLAFLAIGEINLLALLFVWIVGNNEILYCHLDE
jgi:hypothetical protein